MIALGFHFRRERERAEKERVKKLRKRQTSAYFPSSRKRIVGNASFERRRGSDPTLKSTTEEEDEGIVDSPAMSERHKAKGGFDEVENGTQSPGTSTRSSSVKERLKEVHPKCSHKIAVRTWSENYHSRTSSLLKRLQLDDNEGRGGSINGKSASFSSTLAAGGSDDQFEFSDVSGRKVSAPPEPRSAGTKTTSRPQKKPLRSISECAVSSSIEKAASPSHKATKAASKSSEKAGVLERISASAKKRFSMKSS